ncbi:uncharacterized protein LOC111480445 [Cucurbita maxima]|uniref:Uncharacterized protein LOC111480445 n=1 Tax=Cucurbita maxima TaxID=3661 RepID=A0A6J1J1L0_CUCMA|nr:uncharacterized protein LOC111480445 [Cucurbita maxima]
MSWLALSIANTLRLDDEEDEQHNDVVSSSSSTITRNQMESQSQSQSQSQPQLDDEALSRRVKEDLTEFKQTLTRQFWGVATFLAPPPPPPEPGPTHHLNPAEDLAAPPDWKSFEASNQSDPSISGDEEDLTDSIEVLNMRSNHDAYAKSGILQEECYEVDWEGAVGITDEVLTFATNIAMHPETWIDFPIDEEEDNGDFEMSDAQKEHAFTIEHLAPRLAALRFELCPCHMSESYFWKVYFVLLHSRLNKQDAEALSTPQVAEARSIWMQELQKKTKPETFWCGRDTFELKDSSDLLQEDDSSLGLETHSVSTLPWTFTSEPSMSSMSSNCETEKYQIETSETQFIDKSVIVEKPIIKDEDKNSTIGSSSKFLVQNYNDESDNDWLEEDSGAILPLGYDEDISFSDLEDDDMVLPAKFKIVSKE